ncbi:MAG TPA: hypothetical protein HA298_04035 [Methanobacteriales archaeon]|nr:MAG: hypothetical protein XD44_0585 [Methanobacteriaceae archaeon 41_258]MBC7089889.1 hypothetical protein [Methanobacteriaceae archaeon]HIH61839.1 hypothetical protein [Methanobacteriales archaeon]
MDQKILIVGVGALLIGMVIGWTLGLSSTQNLILNITNNSSNDQPVDEPSITQPTQQLPENQTVIPPSEDQEPSSPQDETPPANISQ